MCSSKITQNTTMKTRLFFISFLFLLLVGCGSTAPVDTAQVNKPNGSETPKLVKKDILTRHANNMMSTWETGDFANAHEEYVVLQGLLNEKDPTLVAKAVQRLLPKWPLKDVVSAVQTAHDFKGTELTADDAEGRFPSEEIEKVEKKAENTTADSLPNEDKVRQEVKKILIEFGESEDFEVPDYFLAKVNTWIKVFSDPNRSRDWYERALRRMDKYYPMISDIFSRKRLPQSLYYLALVESGFNPHARSRAGAVGLWQFMRATGRRYGLRVNRRYDQRRNPQKATVAAREYLLDLILEFGDGHSVLLAMAAYNAGENRIRNRLRRLEDYRTRSFWTLSQKNLLPKETNEYVPKILAAAVIAKNKKEFGFDTGLRAEDYVTITLGKPVSVPLLAQLSGLTHENFLEINPDLDPKKLSTPEDETIINVPKNSVKIVKSHKIVKAALFTPAMAQLAQAIEKEEAKKKNKKKPVDTYIVYRVKRGNNLRNIARWFQTSTAALTKSNPYLRKRRGRVRAGDKLYIHNVPKNLETHFYRVNRGDNLHEIASLYQVSPNKIKAWNGVRRYIYEGQQLVIYTGGGIEQWKSATKKKRIAKKKLRKSRNRFVYRVKYRNSLRNIARAFRMPASKIKRANKLRTSRLYAGQRLVIPRSAKKVRYRVRRGDTLQKIARKYKTRISSIKTFNGMRGSRIVIGETLIIYVLG